MFCPTQWCLCDTLGMGIWNVVIWVMEMQKNSGYESIKGAIL